MHLPPQAIIPPILHLVRQVCSVPFSSVHWAPVLPVILPTSANLPSWLDLMKHQRCPTTPILLLIQIQVCYYCRRLHIFAEQTIFSLAFSMANFQRLARQSPGSSAAGNLNGAFVCPLCNESLDGVDLNAHFYEELHKIDSLRKWVHFFFFYIYI